MYGEISVDGMAVAAQLGDWAGKGIEKEYNACVTVEL